MRHADLPFLPIFHTAHSDSNTKDWRQTVHNQIKRLKRSRGLQIGIGLVLLGALFSTVWVVWPKKYELVIPSVGFQDTVSEWNMLTHLILLPGHGIQWCTECGRMPTDESCWYLQSFQHGQVPLFLAHIRRAIEEAANDPKSLLVFSGGQTRPGVGLRTEAHSYFAAAEKLGYFADFDGTNVYDRSVSEDFSRDSLENVMYSVCRFKQVTGQYPRKITVVGFPFKGPRFIELHRKAINFPYENFKYIGVQVEGMKQDHIVDDAYADFKNDLYGCGKKLFEKRQTRNPYRHFHSYKETCSDMLPFLDACAE